MNNKIKLIIRRAYGFRNIENLISMIRLACSEIGRQLQPAYVYDRNFE
ncbi:transposase [uncultured Dubosiella sp.]